MTSYESAYSTAIALNNYGVSLLERHCCNQALEAFKEAVFILRRVVSPDQDTANMLPLSPSFLHGSLQRARWNLATCDPLVVHPILEFCILNEEETGKVLEMVEPKDDQPAVSAKTPLIRIELQTKSLRDVASTGVDLESSIVLYNYASAYKSLARIATTADGSEDFYRGAFQLLELSHSLLQNQKGINPTDELQRLPISFLILRSLAVIATTLGMDPILQEYFVSCFLDAKESFEGIHIVVSGADNVTAAAA